MVAPGADPSAIKLHVTGASGLSTDAQGELLIQTGGGTLVQSAPVLTQAAASAGAAPQTISGGAVLLPGGDVGFRVGAYDTTKPLTIDPVIQYSAYLGGSGSDQAFAVAADGSGDAYVAGTTTSTNFPTTTGVYLTSSRGRRPCSSPSSTPPAPPTPTPPTSPASPAAVATLYGIAVDAAG